jgi:hypothetical protein
MSKPLSPSDQALLHAGLMADRAMRLVGGQGLNGMIPPAHPDDFSDRIKELRFAVEQYNNHILSMSRHDG